MRFSSAHPRVRRHTCKCGVGCRLLTYQWRQRPINTRADWGGESGGGEASVGINIKPHPSHQIISNPPRGPKGPRSLSLSFRPVSRQYSVLEGPISAGAFGRWCPDATLRWMRLIQFGWARWDDLMMSLTLPFHFRRHGTRIARLPRIPSRLILLGSNPARHDVDFKTEPPHHLRESLQGFVVSPDRPHSYRIF